MFRFKILQKYYSKETFTVLKANFSKVNLKFLKPEHEHEKHLIEKYSEMVSFNTVLDRKSFKMGYKANKAKMEKLKKAKEYTLTRKKPIPFALQYINNVEDKIDNVCKTDEKNLEENQEFITEFPLELTDDVKVTRGDIPVHQNIDDPAKRSSAEVEKRRDMINWMSSYENYEENEEIEVDDDNVQVNYGTPDPKCPISNVRCGGCGTLLHCKDTAFPGYLPSEIYKNYIKTARSDFSSIICQRCYFLKNHNVALQVRVPPETYPLVLNQISKHNNVLVLLIVDLLDFPCSIWPGIADLIGSKTPTFVIGNKIDLIPKDDRNYIRRIENQLRDYVKLCGFATTNIKNVSLISAKTGFGVEDLITHVQKFWKYRGDVYLVGCTNVGKSSLFNALLQSDFCKIKATDLIQRATISQWPGTTLNLLKFPIMRPSEDKVYIREQRLKQLNVAIKEEKRLKETGNISNKNASLMDHIGRSYFNSNTVDDGVNDAFNISNVRGFDETQGEFVLGRWCYDTPGVVQQDQVVHLLTVDELMLTLPKQLIRPETFSLKPGYSLFIAGLARLDYINGENSIRATVFRSNELPITVCDTQNADKVYNEFLTTEYFKVPINNEERLKKWPGLEVAKEFSVFGTHWDDSSQDIVLSSAGWVAIHCKTGKEHKFVAWTPEKRGCYLRDCLLPKAVRLRGPRIKNSPAHKYHRLL